MKDDLDRVLEGLSKVEAPAGLEARVRRAMEAREPERHGFGLVWAGVMALVLVGAVVAKLEWKSAGTAGIAKTPTQSRKPIAMGHPELADSVDSPGFRGRVQRHPPTITAPLRVAVIMGHPEAGVAEESGFPAPEAPLSDQEKLLLRLARRPTPQTMAVFNQRLREKHAALAKAEFDEFFKPPVVVATEPDPDLHVANPAGIEEKKYEALAEKQ